MYPSNYGGGYNPYNQHSGTYDPYNINQYQMQGGYPPQPYGNPAGMMNQMGGMMGSMMGGMMNAMYGGRPMHNMPASQQTVIINNNCWSANGAYMNAAMNAGIEIDDDEEEEEEEEEEYDDEEEEIEEEIRRQRKRQKKKAKRQAKIAQKVAEKIEEDEDFLTRLKEAYIGNLKRHLDLDGTLEPTEGTVKTFTKYPADDPVVAFVGDYLADQDWDPEEDCRYLREAMDGAGTNEDAIIHVVGSRSNAQRQQLKSMFKTAYGRDLVEDLDSELSGDFCETIMALFESPAWYDAWCIKEAIYGLGTDESTLIEIFASRTNAQVQAIREVYKDVASPNRKAGNELIEKDIEDDTSGDFKRFLISASQGNRRTLSYEKLEEAVEPVEFDGKPTGQFRINFDKIVNVGKAKRDAQALFEATEDRFGTDEETMIRIFAVNETYQMRRTYEEYVKLTQRDIENTIDRETSGNFGAGILTLVMNLKCRPKYFAQRLVWTMKGLGTKDRDLIRVIVSRAEIDMVQIKACFLEMTKQTLWNWIDQDCSGDYKKILQAIVGKD